MITRYPIRSRVWFERDLWWCSLDGRRAVFKWCGPTPYLAWLERELWYARQSLTKEI